MTSTSEGLFFIALVVLALGLTVLAFRYPELPMAVASGIGWVVLASAFVTGSIGPGFTAIWVGGITILFVLMAFVPLLMQMKQEVTNEIIKGKQRSSWTTRELKTQKPSSTEMYSTYREQIRETIKRGKSRKGRRRSEPSETW